MRLRVANVLLLCARGALGLVPPRSRLPASRASASARGGGAARRAGGAARKAPVMGLWAVVTKLVTPKDLQIAGAIGAFLIYKKIKVMRGGPPATEGTGVAKGANYHYVPKTKAEEDSLKVFVCEKCQFEIYLAMNRVRWHFRDMGEIQCMQCGAKPPDFYNVKDDRDPLNLPGAHIRDLNGDFDAICKKRNIVFVDADDDEYEEADDEVAAAAVADIAAAQDAQDAADAADAAVDATFDAADDAEDAAGADAAYEEEETDAALEEQVEEAAYEEEVEEAAAPAAEEPAEEPAKSAAAPPSKPAAAAPKAPPKPASKSDDIFDELGL
ncbi:hypothetical protein M885DRAFT_534791 [Pelagophyceae sp. CCMP2097]|nr:hypothetical protein M885DRAFT_534791 [Pelagophyceae sp. CCMP2097]